MQRRRVQFAGRVQGVGFRATAREVASGHAVTGWVRNEPDGSVTVEVQGEALELEAFLANLRRRVGRLIQSEFDMTIRSDPHERSFEIRA